MAATTPRPRLLAETAEIALTEIKRYLEPRLCDAFRLRRLSAPVYLPLRGPLHDPGPKVEFALEADSRPMGVVRGLDRWLRHQLRTNHIAEGFGVYTVMNAIRPEEAANATRSPHIAAWAWQQALEEGVSSVLPAARALYSLLLKTDQMVVGLFPHLHSSLAPRMEALRVAAGGPAPSERELYTRLHPAGDADAADPQKSARTLLLLDQGGTRASLITWNTMVGRPLLIADLALRGPCREAGAEAPASVGGNIYRDQLAMQLLHMTQITQPAV